MTTDQQTPAPPAPPAAPAPAPAPEKKPQKRASKERPEHTVAGVVIPGAVLSSLIGLCWLAHQFGLGAVLAAIIACALAATAGLAAAARRGQKRKQPLSGLLSGSGGGGPGRSGGGSGGRVGGSSGGAKKGSSGGGGKPGSGAKKPGGGTRPGGSSGAKSTGPSSKKPGGLGGAKKPSGGLLGGAKNSPAKKGSTGSTSPGKGGGPGGKKPGPSPKTPGSNAPKKDKPRRNPLGLGGKKPSGAGGRSTLPKHRAPKKNSGGGKTGPGKSGSSTRGDLPPWKKNPKKPSTGPTSKSHGKSDSPRTRRDEKAAKSNKGRDGGARTRPEYLRPKNTKSPKDARPDKKTPKTSGSSTKPKDQAAKKAKYQPKKHRAPIGPARRGAYRLGKKLRKRIRPSVRLRIKRVTSPIRTMARTVTRYASPLLATAWRSGSRALVALNGTLNTLAHSNIGPAWLRPLAAVLHAVTSPAARAVSIASSWGWLTTWVYRNTTAGSPPQHKGPSPRRSDAVPPDLTATHRPVSRTAPTSTPGGIPMSSGLQPAMPLIAAQEAVRMAGAMLLVDPADDMVGYEMTIQQLSGLQSAIGMVLRAAAESSRENFKVSPAIPEALDDMASYSRILAAQVAAIPHMYRVIHAEQIENLENPTPQAQKWDIGANQ